MIHKAIETDDPILHIKDSFKKKYEIEHDNNDSYDTWASVVVPIVISMENDFKND